MTNKTLTLQGTDAINLTNISARTNANSVKLASGKYAVNLSSTVKFHGSQLAVDQVILFNNAPLATHNSVKWYSVVDTQEGIQITVQEDMPIYVVLLDQVNSNDNSGEATVTFTKIS